jgi:ABC-type transporter MlaC component
MKFWLFLALSVFAIPSSDAAVLDQSKAFVSQLLDLGKLSRTSKGVVTPESRVAIQTLSSRIDFEALAAKSLSGTWKNLSAAKRKEFLSILQESIEVFLFPKADRITSSLNEVKFTQNPQTPSQVKANTRFETTKQGEVVERTIEFELIFDTKEKVADAILEGEKVSSNLKRQFDQALQKKTFDQLLDQLRKRIADARNPKKPAAPAKSAPKTVTGA